MSIALHTLLPPSGATPGRRSLGWHARFSLRASSVEAPAAAVNGEKGLESTKKRMRKKNKVEPRGLEVLYDDGFGGVTMKDYFEAVRAMPKDDGGPPRWFCPVECGQPEVDKAPVLLFLPGTDGVGMELILHHKSLGKVFEVRCLHIPVNDRTPFEGASRGGCSGSPRQKTHPASPLVPDQAHGSDGEGATMNWGDGEEAVARGGDGEGAAVVQREAVTVRELQQCGTRRRC